MPTGSISIYESGVDLVVEWRLQDFSTLRDADGSWEWSPTFSFDNERWHFMIYPNGWKWHDSSGHVDLCLVKSSSGRSVKVSFSFSLKTAKADTYNEEYYTKNFNDNDCNHRFHRFISRSDLIRRRSELLPDDVLTVVCTVKRPRPARRDSRSSSAEISTPASNSAGCPSGSGATSTAECPHCKLTLEAASLPTHEKSCIDRPMKCPQCGEDVASKLWLEHKCLTAKTNAIGNLLQDMKRLMVCGEHSDVTVSVRSEEFRLHRCILGVRNPFFGSRFNNESQETTAGTLSIDDCDPDQFRTLIHYIYTGTADNLCPENVCGLYEVAVAYQEPQMRDECLQLMMNTLCVDNFCDYTVLALKHNEEELLQKATELFVRKTKEITRHEKWESFLENYPAQANKLYMKALDRKDEK